jgi:hypothetical protein
MSRITGYRSTALVAALAMFASVSTNAGCGSPKDQSPSSNLETTGSVGLQLESGVTLSSAAYEITGNGFQRSGPLDVSNGSPVSALISGIPAGTNYTITLTASVLEDPSLQCVGAASFDVIAGTTTATQVHMRCDLPPRTGGVLVTGTLNVCPRVDALSLQPAATSVGRSVTLSASASDLDALPAALTYTWSSNRGVLSDIHAENAKLTCTLPGQVQVTLTVSDGDCEAVATAKVTCLAVIDPGSGGNSGMGGATSSGGASGEGGFISAGGANAGANGGAGGSTSDGAKVRINEAESSSGTPGDWVELYNAGTAAADLSGWTFKDADDTHAYLIPAGTVLAPGAYYLLEEAAFGFGLGGNDSARLYDKANALVDAHAWTSHAGTTYGRCPNASGDFTTTASATKGTANDCGTNTGAGGAGAGGAPSASFETWPGQNQTQTVDVANTFASNLSGLTYEAASETSSAVLWAVQNGPGTLYKLIWNGSNWLPSGENGWSAGKSLRYPNGTGNPDAEGITKAETESAFVYVATERNNDASTVSRLSVLRFPTSSNPTELVATHEWNLTLDLPTVGANLGLEAITWIPDQYLVLNGFVDENTQQPYEPQNYSGHGPGLFFVGVEATGLIHAYALNHEDNSFKRIATLASGVSGVMGLEFDRNTFALWATCDNTCNNRSSILGIDTSPTSATRGRFKVRRSFEPPSSLANLNNEGIAIAPQTECVNGFKHFFWADDGSTEGHALRRDSIPCAALF